MNKLTKIEELKRKIDEVSQKHTSTTDEKEEKIYQYLIKNYSIINKEMIKSFTREKEIVKRIMEKLATVLPMLIVFHHEDEILKVGKDVDFNGNAYFSAKHDKSFFYTPNTLEKLFVNKTCVHPAKLEEAALMLIEIKKQAEVSNFEVKDFFV